MNEKANGLIYSHLQAINIVAVNKICTWKLRLVSFTYQTVIIHIFLNLIDLYILIYKFQFSSKKILLKIVYLHICQYSLLRSQVKIEILCHHPKWSELSKHTISKIRGSHYGNLVARCKTSQKAQLPRATVVIIEQTMSVNISGRFVRNRVNLLEHVDFNCASLKQNPDIHISRSISSVSLSIHILVHIQSEITKTTTRQLGVGGGVECTLLKSVTCTVSCSCDG